LCEGDKILRIHKQLNKSGDNNMTGKRTAILVILTVAGAAACLTADQRSLKTALTRRGVTFEKWGYKLKLMEMKSQCEVNLGGRSKKRPSRYTLDLKGVCTLPGDVDGVVIANQLRVLKVADAAGKDLRVPPKRSASRSPQKYRTGTFAPILVTPNKVRAAEVGINRLALTANPYTIEKLDAEVIVLIAKERTTKTLPAAVSRKMQEVIPGLKIRIAGMKAGTTRELTIELAEVRAIGGPRGPFVYAVAMLGDDGKTIGEGQIVKGDPLGKSGTVTTTFPLKSEDKVTSVRVTIVTDYTIRKVPFELTGIFKR